jgi:hypothetical protein
MSIRTAFLRTADATRPLLDDPVVDDRWDEPSALPLMTIGALAAHLTRAVLTVNHYLAADDRGLTEDLIDAAGYFGSVDELTTPDGPDLANPLHTAIRDRAADGAEGGPDRVRSQWDEGMLELHATLATEPATRTLTVLGGRRIMIDDYLVTRLVELVVHGDDLATSIGIAPPEVPSRAGDLVIECLVKVAVDRHGPLAVIRAMTRTERDSIHALRVL